MFICSLPQSTLLLASISTTANAKAERWSSTVLQWSNNRPREKVRDSKIPLATGKKAVGKIPTANRETSEDMVPEQESEMEALEAGLLAF